MTNLKDKPIMPYDPNKTTFDGECKNCGTEMEELHSEGHDKMDIEYWYSECGTVFQWHDAYPVDTGLWQTSKCFKKKHENADANHVNDSE